MSGLFLREVELMYLRERFYDFAPTTDPTKVFLNPTLDELRLVGPQKSRRARGILEGPNLFVWPEDKASHEFVAQHLELKIDVPFYAWYDPSRTGFHFGVSEYTLEISKYKNKYKALAALMANPKVARLAVKEVSRDVA